MTEREDDPLYASPQLQRVIGAAGVYSEACEAYRKRQPGAPSLEELQQHKARLQVSVGMFDLSNEPDYKEG